MVQYSGQVDTTFGAIADATRRAVLERLARSDASISELADAFDMTLTGMRKHVRVLEDAGLVTTEKIGRVRTCRLGPSQLADEARWIEEYRQLWNERFSQLDAVVEELKRKEKTDEPGRGD
ncbi:MAG TPA: metalloregulator ArsR/SmtB family transcription factor [Candidatus Limnocylindria bacterium]|nr:metalloregulator ArsR/SmtB family transcription factor [Candidatus Limnocylindria bacterium]